MDKISKAIDKKIEKIAEAKQEVIVALRSEAQATGVDNWMRLVPREKLNWKDRGELESILASVGIESYPNETDEELKDAIIANIEDGTLDASVVE